MVVYYYHAIPIKDYLGACIKTICPGHTLYGITEFERYGIDYIYHGYDVRMSRMKLMFYNAFKICFCKQKYDAIYAVTFRGLEIIILLRALGLFKKPIAVWHHTAVVIPKNRIKRIVSSFFYKGFDKLFFFSDELLNRSLLTGKVKQDNAYVVHWGADLHYYSRIRQKMMLGSYFISTGVEHRDFTTLFEALGQVDKDVDCHLYIRTWQKNQIQKLLNERQLSFHVSLNFGDWSLDECAHFVNDAYAVVICCQDYPYTVGLTTLVEALALGKAVITTDNPTFPIDVEKEGIGIKIPYGDVEGWVKAINYMSEHPEEVKEMGRKARLLAERSYNLERCSKEIADVLLSLKK